MVVLTTPTASKSPSSIFDYALLGPAHYGMGARVLLVDGIGCQPETARRDFARVRDRWGKNDFDRVKLYHQIISYTKDEIDPTDPSQFEKAMEHARELIEQAYPGCQALLVAQADGEGGKFHIHVIINAVAYEDAETEVVRFRGKQKSTTVVQRRAGQTVNGELRDINRGRRLNDALVEKHFGIDNREQMKAPLVRVDARDLKLRSQGKYNWRDDLRERIEKAGAQGGSIEDFDARLAEDGISVHRRRSTAKTDGISYAFKGKDGKSHKARGQSLGADYMVAGTTAALSRANAQRAVEEAQRRAEAARQAQEAARAQEEQRKAQQAQEAARRAQAAAQEEAARKAREAAEEAQRQEAAALEQAKAEAARLAAERKAVEEAAAEAARRQQEEAETRLAAERQERLARARTAQLDRREELRTRLVEDRKKANGNASRLDKTVERLSYSVMPDRKEIDRTKREADAWRKRAEDILATRRQREIEWIDKDVEDGWITPEEADEQRAQWDGRAEKARKVRGLKDVLTRPSVTIERDQGRGYGE